MFVLVIYLDSLWLLNWAMNWWLLWATAKTLRRQAPRARLMWAASLGAMSSLLWLLLPGPTWVLFSLKVVVAIAMVNCCFTPRGLRQCLEHTGVFLLISALCAGLTLGMALFGVGGVSEALPSMGWYIVVGGPILMTLPVQRLWANLGRQFRHSEQSARFEFVLQGISVSLLGLLDTGNVLLEPLSYRPVVVVDAEAISDLLPEELLSLVYQWDKLGETLLDSLPDWLASRLTLIPYTAVAGGGMMVGIRPDSCSILVKGSWHPVDAVIGFAPLEFAAGEKFALLPAEVWPMD